MTTIARLARGALLALTLSLTTISASADVVAVVSSTSAVTTLSNAQVADIFLGKVASFPNGTQAIPIDQAAGSSARDEFYAAYTGKSPAQVKTHWARIIFTGRGQPPEAISNDTALKKRIASDPRAIGYIERSALDSSVKVILQR